MSTLHSAPLVLPVTGAPLADGAVLVTDGRIEAVGPRADLAARHPAAQQRHWAGILTPGLVNAHAHLQYTDFEELNTGEPFAVWIGRLVAKRATFTSELWRASTRRGLALMLESGTTAVADVVTDYEVLEPSAESGLAGISYLECVFEDDASWADGGRDRLLTGLDGAPAGRAVGVSPHTPFTLGTAVFADCVAIGRERGLRTHTHVAESPAETEYVASGTGPFEKSMTAVGKTMELIRDGGCGLTPTAYLDRLGVLGPDVHAAHCVHCGPEDREALRRAGVYAALCTRSNRILEAGEAPIADYLREDAPFAVGTDSLASTPSLDMLAETAALRALARRQGYAEADLDRRLFAAATIGGAAAMGLSDIGRLEPGARADLAVFALPGLDDLTADESLYRTLLDAAEAGDHRCIAVVLGGEIRFEAAAES